MKPRVIWSNVLSVKMTVLKFPIISLCRDQTVVFITLTGFHSKSLTELIFSLGHFESINNPPFYVSLTMVITLKLVTFSELRH